MFCFYIISTILLDVIRLVCNKLCKFVKYIHECTCKINGNALNKLIELIFSFVYVYIMHCLFFIAAINHGYHVTIAIITVVLLSQLTSHAVSILSITHYLYYQCCLR